VASAVARAQAAAMRRFEPGLSDADVATIAHGIDDNLAAGALLAGRSHPLRNDDAPATVFIVTFPRSASHGFGEHGLPTGLTFLGAAFDEAKLVAIGTEYQARTTFALARPNVGAHA